MDAEQRTEQEPIDEVENEDDVADEDDVAVPVSVADQAPLYVPDKGDEAKACEGACVCMLEIKMLIDYMFICLSFFFGETERWKTSYI